MLEDSAHKTKISLKSLEGILLRLNCSVLPSES